MAHAVLVTGGAGYIGSHTCKALVRAGYLPVAFDNHTEGQPRFVRWGPLVRGDTRDAGAVAAAIRGHRCIAVMHFAALSSVAESLRVPGLYHGNNVGGLRGVLTGMHEAGCETIVFSSSAAVYGEPSIDPIPETSPPSPINPYGETKLVGERILADQALAGRLRWIALRYFNAAGADPDGEIGEFRQVETHLIPRALMSIQGWVEDFQVFGSDFPTPDGTAIRDYVHVSDLADAHVLALGELLVRPVNAAFNIGSGKGHSVSDVLAAIARATGSIPPPAGGPRRLGDPAVLVADGSLARRTLGFEPILSDLDTIVRTAWDWHRKAHPKRAMVQETPLEETFPDVDRIARGEAR